MRTLGIDLAAQDKKTAWCAINWAPGSVMIEAPVVGGPGEELMEAMCGADWIGIDAPFGWPDAMVEAIHRYATEGDWPVDAIPERLRYRATDRFVQKIISEERDLSVRPLSVSSDRIAVCAWRCATLLREFGERTGWRLDRVGVPAAGIPDDSSSSRSGPGTVVEVYPAGALALWGFPFKGYKRTASNSASDAIKQRCTILSALEQEAHNWLSLTDEVRTACLQDDDSFDSLLSSLVARAVATDKTLHPPLAKRTTAAREGWIHLPVSNSVEGLGS